MTSGRCHKSVYIKFSVPDEISGITLIKYGLSQMFGKPNNLEVFRSKKTIEFKQDSQISTKVTHA